MFNLNRQKAEWKERIKYTKVEEITNHMSNDLFVGFVPFEYLTIKKEYQKVDGKIARSKTLYTLTTKADLEFKIGDVVRLFGKEQYTIEKVEQTIPKQFESLIAMNPNIDVKRYQIKVLTLYA